MKLEKIMHYLTTVEGLTDSEFNLRQHVISKILNDLGYKPASIDLEHPLCRTGKKDLHADIVIQISPESMLIVETKRKSKKLNDNDVNQLTEYMSLCPKITWGILTNGYEYYLISNQVNINGYNNIADRIVLKISLSQNEHTSKNTGYFKYLSKECLFDNGVSYYFVFIAQFFAYKKLKPESKTMYENTLYRFFDFIIKKKKNYKFDYTYKYHSLEKIHEEDVLDFFENVKSKTRAAYGAVPMTKCSHISSFFSVMEKVEHISINPMRNLRSIVKTELKSTSKRPDIDNILTEEVISIILNSAKLSIIARIAFILSAYYAFSRRLVHEFISLNWEMVSIKKKYFILRGMKYYMNNALACTVQSLKKRYKENGIKSPKAIYLTASSGYSKVPTGEMITEAFSEISMMEELGDSKKYYTMQNIRASAIYNLFKVYSIEEIEYLSNTSLANILKYIPEKMIKEVGYKRFCNRYAHKAHPFSKCFE